MKNKSGKTQYFDTTEEGEYLHLLKSYVNSNRFTLDDVGYYYVSFFQGDINLTVFGKDGYQLRRYNEE